MIERPPWEDCSSKVSKNMTNVMHKGESISKNDYGNLKENVTFCDNEYCTTMRI